MTGNSSREPHFDPPYDQLLDGVLRFRTLTEAEATLQHLEELRQRFLASSDKKGEEYCLRLGALGRRRAQMIARNQRISAAKRLVKQEAALWFGVWLETPGIFADWLALRKQAEEFKKLLQLESGS